MPHVISTPPTAVLVFRSRLARGSPWARGLHKSLYHFHLFSQLLLVTAFFRPPAPRLSADGLVAVSGADPVSESGLSHSPSIVGLYVAPDPQRGPRQSTHDVKSRLAATKCHAVTSNTRRLTRTV